MLKLILILASAVLASSAFAKVKIVTTTPDLAWAAARIAGEHGDVTPLLKGKENPHYVDAVPNFIRLVANADVVCSVGLSLEVGWLPKVLAKSGNAAVQPGGKGFCETGKGVKPLNRPQGKVDRSMGDVHPDGNPHFWLDPVAFADGVGEMVAALSRVDAPNRAHYEKNYTTFKAEMEALRKSLDQKLEAVKGLPVMQYHTDFDYFIAVFGLKAEGSIEEKPGVPPSAGRLARVGTAAKRAKVKLALAVDYDPQHALHKFQELSGVPVAKVATMSRPGSSIDTYPKMMEAMAAAIVKALGSTGK